MPWHAGRPTRADAHRLHRLVHRGRTYLGLAASAPLIGVPAGLIFLVPARQLLVIGPNSHRHT
ncbi:hypothetical protein ABIA39_003028 [Nocardia sp. GAS34]|jgi:hypothetical protein|uniref:hypothetical protein n=1 Tax=unclassified Nocardia TaxID=2637762 RepID=UPI003D205B2E